MTNDGWGKPPATNNGWGTPTVTPHLDDKEKVADGWGTPAPHNWGKAVDVWPRLSDKEPEFKDAWGKPVKDRVDAPREVSTNHDKLFAPYGADGSWNTQNPATAWPDAPSDGAIYAKVSENNAPGAWEDAKAKFEASGWGAAAGFKPDPALPACFIHPESDAPFIVDTMEDYDEAMTQGCEEVTKAEYDAAVERQYQARETKWRDDRIMGVEMRSRAINAINQTRGQEYTVSRDGELDAIEKPKPGEKTGVFIAYKKPNSLLHAILSGPYPNQAAASLWADDAFDRMTEDTSFQIAFEKVFERDAVYFTELPTWRKGAYGVLS